MKTTRVAALVSAMLAVLASAHGASAALQHCWTLDSDTNVVTGGTGYLDTGAAPVQVPLWWGIEAVVHGGVDS